MTLIEEKFIDLIINIISIVFGGGLILLFIEWQRHEREKKKWAEEDQQLAIDIPRAEMRVSTWQIEDGMNEQEELRIHRNQLEGTIKQLTIVVEFVIRNTTQAEIIITSYGSSIVNVPTGAVDIKRYYDLETFDLIEIEDIGAIKLQPLASLPRMAIIVSSFDERRKLETPPATVMVEAITSSGRVIQKNATLTVVQRFTDISHYQGQNHPKKYIEKILASTGAQEEDDIPF